MKLPIFNHKLYGRCLLMPNYSFIVSNTPTAINYVLLGTIDEELEIRHSGIYDSGLNDNREVLSRLKELGY